GCRGFWRADLGHQRSVNADEFLSARSLPTEQDTFSLRGCGETIDLRWSCSGCRPRGIRWARIMSRGVAQLDDVGHELWRAGGQGHGQMVVKMGGRFGQEMQISGTFAGAGFDAA